MGCQSLWELIGAEKAKHFVTLAATLKISRDSNKLCYLAGSAYMMNAQICGGGHMIDAYTQLRGVFVNILSSHIYPLHLVYMCAPVQACTCTTHPQAWTCMHNCTHMLFYSSVLFFLSPYLSLLFFTFSCLFSTLSQGIFSFSICLSPSLFSQPQFWFSVSFYQPSAVLQAEQQKSIQC